MTTTTATPAVAAATVAPKAPRAPRTINTAKPPAKVATPAAPKAAPAIKAAPVKPVTTAKKPTPAPAAKKQEVAPAPQVTQAPPALRTGRGKAYTLVAGNILTGISDDAKKGLSRGLGYHVAQKNLSLADGTYTLTRDGQAGWYADYVKNNPDMWRIIAQFVRGTGEVPEMWSGHPVVQVAKGVRLPNPVYWGGFAKLNMRLAFRAMWAGTSAT